MNSSDPSPSNEDRFFSEATNINDPGTLRSPSEGNATPVHRPGDYIGLYRLIERIGYGGMGEVWRAEQEKPVKRQVALKLIRSNVRSDEILIRFEAERQALTLMNHPNISRILDSGSSLDGQPYFAMELAVGSSLTTYCDQQRLSLDERLRIFIQVCSAVQHAHQKGIIHRDLKPSNIMVTLDNGEPVPKVIDFGLAKALDSTQRLSDKSLFTGIGQILGTIKYMSPEQASLNSIDIDTRADIYSLGVILYELLVGKVPLDDESLRGLNALRLLELIREKEPVAPSQKFRLLSELEKRELTETRKTSSIRLGQLLIGDLDWIVLKAIDKDRARRYDSAAALANDIERYLQHDPIEARPPSARYRMGKFVRKNKTLVVATSLVMAALVSGVVGTSWGMLRAQRARDDADRARNLASIQKKQAESSLARAERAESDLAKRVSELEALAHFQSLQIAQIDLPTMASKLRNDLVQRATLGQAPGALESDAAPEIATDKRASRGIEILDRINFLDVAKGILKENIFEKTVATSGEFYADNPTFRATILQAVADSAYQLGLFEEAEKSALLSLEIRREELGDEDHATIQSMNTLASILVDHGKLSEAETYHRQVHAQRSRTLGESHADTLASLNNVAIALYLQGKLEEAEALQNQCVQLCQLHLGPESTMTLQAQNDHSQLLLARRKFEDSEKIVREVWEMRKRILGEEHRDTLSSLINLGFTLNRMGRRAEAEDYYRQAVEISRKAMGNEHPNTLLAISNLATLLMQLEKFNEAEPLLRETLEARLQLLGDHHPSTLLSMNNMAGWLSRNQRLDESEKLFRKALEGFELQFDPDHPNVVRQVRALGKILVDLGRKDEAIPLLLRAAKLGERTSMAILFQVLTDQGNQDRLDELSREIMNALRENKGKNPLEYSIAIGSLASELLKKSRFARAEESIRIGLDGPAIELDAAWNTFRMQLLLLRSQVGQGKLDPTAPSIAEAVEGLVREQANIPADIRAEVLSDVNQAKP